MPAAALSLQIARQLRPGFGRRGSCLRGIDWPVARVCALGIRHGLMRSACAVSWLPSGCKLHQRNGEPAADSVQGAGRPFAKSPPSCRRNASLARGMDESRSPLF